jgi:hypothetical protein
MGTKEYKEGVENHVRGIWHNWESSALHTRQKTSEQKHYLCDLCVNGSTMGMKCVVRT